MFVKNSKNNKSMQLNILIVRLVFFYMTIHSFVIYNITKPYNNLKVYYKYINRKIGMFLNIIVYCYDSKFILAHEIYLETQIELIEK